MTTVAQPRIQIAVDVDNIARARSVVQAALAAGADWIEIGKPLIEFEGIRAAAELCRSFPGAYVLMDLMIMAAPRKYIEAAAQAGVRNVTVTALAPWETVKAAIDVGHEAGVEVTVDMFNVADPVDCARRAEAAGADYVMVHFGVDQKRNDPSGSPIATLRRVAETVRTPVSYATYDIAESLAACAAGAAVIVQGEPLISAANVEAAVRAFIDETKDRNPNG